MAVAEREGEGEVEEASKKKESEMLLQVGGGVACMLRIGDSAGWITCRIFYLVCCVEGWKGEKWLRISDSIDKMTYSCIKIHIRLFLIQLSLNQSIGMLDFFLLIL